MMIAQITVAQKEQILWLEEDHFHDLKSRDIKPSKLTESVSAFANSSGGEIYLGIDELDKDQKVRHWRGFTSIEQANAHLQETEKLAPLANHFDAVFLSCDSEDTMVLQLTIPKSKDIIYASNGKAYIRKSAQKIPVDTSEALYRLKLDKGINSFEDATLDIALDEIANSETIIEFLLNVIPSAEPEPWLRKQKLILKDKPTAAGILLFSDEPQASLPKRCGIKIYRYKTRTDTYDRDTLAFDPITVEGCIYKLIYYAVEKTIYYIEDIRKLGKSGLEKISYPPETLHEILTNAVLHRDYSITNDIHVRIFDNRLEIESPGRLPGHITLANILTEQFARNPKVVRLVNKFPNPPNKDVGEGLNTAFEAMRRLRLKEPEIIENSNSVLVVIKHESLASPEETIIEYLEDHDEIANKIARELTGVKSEGTMSKVFLRLSKMGLIEPVPDRKGAFSAWRKVLPKDEDYEFKYITRIDSIKTHGWYIRVPIQGKLHSKLFSDLKCGGKDVALQEASKYRDALMVLRGLKKRTPFRIKPTSRSSTGIAGISETYSRVAHGRRKGEKEPCFTVTWSPQPNNKKVKKFFFHRYGGRDSALEAAIAFRKEKEEEILKTLE
ncbi:MAG: ATP-binding protein [Candidatus Methanoperedens sp.]